MKDQFIYFLTWAELGLLSIVLILIVRNILRYVIHLKRYKEFHIALFYSIALMIVSLRITGHTLVLVMNINEQLENKLIYQTWVI